MPGPYPISMPSEVRRGEAIRAAGWNEVVQALKTSVSWKGSKNVGIAQNPNGSRLIDNNPLGFDQSGFLVTVYNESDALDLQPFTPAVVVGVGYDYNSAYDADVYENSSYQIALRVRPAETYPDWDNDETYSIGDILKDTSDDSFWLCEVGHTSASAPTTFASDRSANPTYWTATNKSSPDELGRFVVMRDLVPARTGDPGDSGAQMFSGKAWWSGYCMVALGYAGSDTPGEWCDIDPTQSSIPEALWTRTDGTARVVWSEASLGTQPKFAIVHLNARASQPTTKEFWARITGNFATNGSGTGNSSNPSTQWRYSFEEVEKTTNGYATGATPSTSGWTAIDDGRTATASATEGLLNGFEDINTSIVAATDNAIMGNGATLAKLSLDGGTSYDFYPRPIATGDIVRVYEVEADGKIEYWMSCPNGIDGECP